MSEEKKNSAPEKTLEDEVLDRVNGGGTDTCPHYNKVRTSTGWKCLDCGSTW